MFNKKSKCKKCGKSIDKNSNFCSSCGSKINNDFEKTDAYVSKNSDADNQNSTQSITKDYKSIYQKHCSQPFR